MNQRATQCKLAGVQCTLLVNFLFYVGPSTYSNGVTPFILCKPFDPFRTDKVRSLVFM